MGNLVILGAQYQAKVVIDIIERSNEHKIVGLVDNAKPVGASVLGYSVVGADANLAEIVANYGVTHALIGIGDNFIRWNVSQFLRTHVPEIQIATAIHPSAVIAKDVMIGEGTSIMAGAVLNPSCRIGRFCIVNTRASLDHDCIMGDFSSLGPGAVTGGNCRVGNWAAIGVGAVLRHGVSVGEHSVVGGGSMVVKDISPKVVAYGVPSRQIRRRLPGEKYL